MKALLIVCLLLFVAAVFFFAGQNSNSAHGPATIINAGEEPQNAQASEARPLKVSALKLFVDYQRNEVAADNVYKGRLLAVQGVVSSINKDIFDKIYIALATPNQFMNVQAHMDAGNESKAASLQVGEPVTVVCIGNGMIVGSPMLQKCSFAETQSSTVTDNTSVQQPAVQQEAEATTDSGATNSLPMPEAGANGVYKIGGAVSAPVLTYSVEPEYTEQARQSKVAGNVLVNLIVDENGLPRSVGVARGIENDLGLNEKAVEAVQQYKFKPAIANGKPVPVELNVQVNFQIF